MTALAEETIEQKYERYGLHPVLPAKFDHSTSGIFQECERMFYWMHVLGRVPKLENYSFRWGKTFHKVVECWLLTGDTDAVMQIISEDIPEITEDRYGRNRRRMVDLFVEWAKFDAQNQLKVMHTEQPITIACLDGPCPYSDSGCGLVYGGRLDRIVDWNGIVGPLDVKTSVTDDQDPVAEYKPSHQMMGYLWLGAHIMGKHIWGVILEKAVCNKGKLQIKRHPITFTKDNVREWAENEIRLQTRIADRFRTSAFVQEDWVQNHFRCYKPYKCAYREVCLAPRDMDFRLKFLATNTVEARWDYENPEQKDQIVAAAMEE
jgi:hypothetical protein